MAVETLELLKKLPLLTLGKIKLEANADGYQ